MRQVTTTVQKVEGLALIDDRQGLRVINDNDFGVAQYHRRQRRPGTFTLELCA